MEHDNNLKMQSEKSFMLKHIKDKHPNYVASYTAKVMATAKDCLTRQVREAVHLWRSEVLILNSNTEWHQPALYRIQREIFRGLCCGNYFCICDHLNPKFIVFVFLSCSFPMLYIQILPSSALAGKFN